MRCSRPNRMADPVPCPGWTIRISSTFTKTSRAGGPGRFSTTKMAIPASLASAIAYAQTSMMPDQCCKVPRAAAHFMIDAGQGPPACSSVGQHRANVGLGNGRAIHNGVAVKPPHGLATADAAHVVFDGIAGHDRLAKLALVDGEKINRARFFGAFDRQDADDASGLCHGFDHHHPGIDRPLGKMTRKRRLVDRHVLDPDTAVVAPDIDDPVDQQHRIAMRKRLEDGIDVHDLKSDRCLHQSRPSPFESAVPSRTKRSTATISRNHCLVGFAQLPPPRPFSGLSSLTALIAVTTAPSPMRRWLLIPTLAPSATLSPIVRLPASPIWAASRQCLPIVTLWPIWT